MTYKELVEKIHTMSMVELRTLRDTVMQQIATVHQSDVSDPESYRADLIDQLNAIRAELQKRYRNGQMDLGPMDAPRPVVPGRKRKPTGTNTEKFPWKTLGIILLGVLIFKMLTR